MIFGDACTGIDLQPERATVRFASGKEVRARLLVLADGGANASRIPGHRVRGEGLRPARARSASVRCDRAHGDRAYERFTPRGPDGAAAGARIATRSSGPPRPPRRSACSRSRRRRSSTQLQSSFGDRAGTFRSRYRARLPIPLRLRTVNSTVALRTALVGNAAQALHPIAGQGLNLGLRDATALAAAISRPLRRGAGRPRDARGLSRVAPARCDARRRLHRPPRRRPSPTAAGCRRWGRGLALTALDLFPRRAALARRAHDPRSARRMTIPRCSSPERGARRASRFACACRGFEVRVLEAAAPARLRGRRVRHARLRAEPGLRAASCATSARGSRWIRRRIAAVRRMEIFGDRDARLTFDGQAGS